MWGEKMPVRPPLMDARSFEDILAQLRQSAKLNIADWQSDSDAGVMLQHTFGRLREIIIGRLNQAPQKHMLAFLDALGISPLPPVPAQTALVFSLKKKASAAFIAKGTTIAATTKDGGSPLVFETKQDLLALPAKIASAYTCEPDKSRYGDYSDCINGAGLTPFIGNRLMADAYYFIDDIALSIEEPDRTYVYLYFKESAQGLKIKNFLDNIDWFFSDGEGISKCYPTAAALDSGSTYGGIKLEIDPAIAPSPASRVRAQQHS
jgi:hypothetical protein